jgi:hypothetical protein
MLRQSNIYAADKRINVVQVQHYLTEKAGTVNAEWKRRMWAHHCGIFSLAHPLGVSDMVGNTAAGGGCSLPRYVLLRVRESFCLADRRAAPMLLPVFG